MTFQRKSVLALAAAVNAFLFAARTPLEAATLATASTVIEVEAGAQLPRVVTFGAVSARWENLAPEEFVQSVSLNNHSIPVRWKLLPEAGEISERRVAFVYVSGSPRLRATWWWQTRAASGPLEHGIEIRNLSSDELWLPLQPSLRLRIKAARSLALQTFSVEKGAGKPSDVGTRLAPLTPGEHWSGESSTYALTKPEVPREIIPFVAVRERHRTLPGWYAGLEFSGRVRLSLHREQEALSFSAGLNPDPGPFATRLPPGAAFETPVVFFGAFPGDLDEMGNVLRPWVREVLGNPAHWRDQSYPLLVNNSWGSGMEVDEQLARQMIRDSAELGLEMFHLDAGWFRGVGDWYPDPKKFPHGLASLADFAHGLRLRFGLWVDWTQAGLDPQPGALNLRDRTVLDWTVSDLPPNWHPQEFKGQTIDLGVRATQAYAGREVQRIVEDYRLDMLEHDGYLVAQGCVRTDHPHAPPDPKNLSIVESDGSYLVRSTNSTDVSYHAVRAYYDVYERLRKLHPNLLLEICNDGGRMVDFGSAAHGDYFSITDTYDPLANRRAFYDASYLLPAAMLETYVAKWPVRNLASFRYMLRSGMLGWTTIMQDTTAWSGEQHAAAKQEFALYKAHLRPLIREAALYHVSARPDGRHWDGIEYFDATRRKGVLYAFHGSDPAESSHAFRLAGLDPKARYRLHFHDQTESDVTRPGSDLMASGLKLNLPLPESSELVFVQEVMH